MAPRSSWAGLMAWTALAAAPAAAFAVQDPAAVPEATPGSAIGMASSEDPDEVLALVYNSLRLSIPVSVDGRGPYQFLVDTGAERTVISRELASKLSLKPGGTILVHSMTGPGMVKTAMIPTLQVSRRAVTDIKAPALSATHIGAAGMLGIDTLERQRLLLDFVAGTMTLARSEPRPTRSSGDEIIVTARSRYGRLVFVNARAEGENITVIVDTGSDISIGNRALLAKLGRKQKLRETQPVELTSVMGGKMTVDYTTLANVEFEGLTLQNMPVAFADVHPFKELKLLDKPALLLGMDTMGLFDQVSIDFGSRKVKFVKPDGASMKRRERLLAGDTPAPRADRRPL